MGYRFDNLVFEITRKCNMKCRHCLRGAAQNKTMSKEVMLQSLRNVSHIHSVTFSGGEPTLALDIIWHFIECCKMLNIYVGNFYIVTNGKVYRRELEDVCEALYNFCRDNECSALTVSDDEFHREWQPKRYLFEKTRDRYYYGEDMYYSEIQHYGDEPELKKPYANYDDKSHKDGKFYGIINMGRAKDNYLGQRELNICDPCVEVSPFNENALYVMDTTYITYNGDYISTCDCSYKEMNKYKFGDIYHKDEAFKKFIINNEEEDEDGNM